MSFMQAQVEAGVWVKVETKNGTDVIRGDLVIPPMMQLDTWYEVGEEGTEGVNTFASNIAQYTNSNIEDIYEVCITKGWGVRLSAPGYMDCTEWSVFSTEKQARDYLAEAYDIEA